MLQNLITKIFGSKYEKEVKKLWPVVERINEFYATLSSLSDNELAAKTTEFKSRLAEGETLDDLLPEAYAVVKEVCRRLCGRNWDVVGFRINWEMVPFDVQLLGAITLHQGKIAEMATGEGKTLVATLPLYLNALTGRGVHLVTVNDYLARRDSEWMGEIFKFLGLTVGCIQNQMDNPTRQIQYDCDITYGTNNEFGFDYLRDNMAIRQEDRVQRRHYFAIVDEVDSVLIDEARTPLIISGPVQASPQKYSELKPMVEQLARKQTILVNQLMAEAEQHLEKNEEYEAGEKLLTVRRGSPKNKKFLKLTKEPGVLKLIQRVDNDYLRDKKLHVLDNNLYYSIDEKEHTVNLNEMGRSLLSPEDQQLFVIPDIVEGLHHIDAADMPAEEKLKQKETLYAQHADRSEKVHNIGSLLKAYSLFEKDVDYVVQDGKVLIVDEFTGRLMPGRRYSEGLHQAIEAKEGVKVEGDTQTWATITLQNYFRLYEKLAGMTGTAVTEAGEFWEIYKLDVSAIPTNEPVRRIDSEDVVYRTKREKFNAIINEIVECHNSKRPVLVGTISVEVSETLSRMLKRAGIPHSVLNAKYHQQEAEIVAKAGQPGAVTIATNMAGRGTDIKLAAEVVKSEGCRLVAEPTKEGIQPCPYLEELDCYKKVPCGLHIIGTERHEARRIDRQLRGRSGRQGDPGSSKFYLSLEDDLMRLFGSDRIASVMDRLGIKEGEVIEHRMVTNAIERAQKRVEAQNFSIRKHLLEYDNVMNQQREVIYDRRLTVLESEDLKAESLALIQRVLETKIDKYAVEEYPENWNLEGLREELLKLFILNARIPAEEVPKLDKDILKERLQKAVEEIYNQKEKALTPTVMRQLERFAFLSTIDDLWKEHLYEIDEMKRGIGLRAYGQRDPLLEYKQESFRMFTELLDRIDDETVEKIYKVRVAERPQSRARMPKPELELVHQESTGMGYAAAAVGAAMGATGSPSEPQDAKRKPVRVAQKVGRNDPCPCGSGKKYKKCHGA
ncbi:MAG: preprotein translocase subunit SecA [candidate division Zixibacteria bacterium]|nr:preprotein translocase subunit SecA [candidate division Zixibacteria bacterium]